MMRKITLFVIIFFLATFGTVREVESYEIWGCCCCPNWGCELWGLPCCCDMEEFGDDSGDEGCGLVWPAVDAVGDDEYCEIIPPGNELEWQDRWDDCDSACDTTCTHDDDCDSNICGALWQDPSDDTCTSCDTGSECTQGYEIMAKLESCPSKSEYELAFGKDPNGYICVVTVDKGWDPFAGPLIGMGNFDSSEGKCVYCDGKIESKIIATTSSIDNYVDESTKPCVDLPFVIYKSMMADCPIDGCGCGWERSATGGWWNYFTPPFCTCHADWDCCGNFKDVSGDGECETACGGVDSACDEVAEGGLCKAGELCESLGVGVTCSGTEKCVDCKCERKTCGNGKVDPGEECDGNIDTKAEGATKDCEGLCAPPGEADECTCRSATCGNGVIDPGEECDGNVDTIAEGATKDCEGRCVPPNKSPLPCNCQICGNNRIEYPEQCDPPDGTTCDGNCQLMGPPPTLPSGGCGGDYGCETKDITYTETKTLQHGNIKYHKKYSEVFPGEVCGWGAQLYIWLPWTTGPGDYKWPVILEGNSVTYTKSPDEYTVKLVDVHLGCDTITVEACCNPAPIGETDCHDGIDNNVPPNGKIDCEEGDAVCPEPDCGPCGTAVCDPGTYGDYEYHCELKAGAECAVPADCPPPGNPGDYECPLAPGPDQCKCVPLIEVDCSNGVDDDGDGCTDGEDVDCGGKETDCFDVIDNNCDGETDCADPDCRFTAPDCNDCQNLTCNADGTWQWSCPTKAGAECSSNTECWATTKWCNLETCNCEEPPPTLASKWRIEDVACKIIVLLQKIVAGIATLIIVYAGIKWMGSGVTDPAARQEAADMIKAVFVGLVIIIVALQFINYMFGNELGTVSCPVNVTWHNMVIICDVPYMCDDANSDGICPEDFGITCDVPDKDC